ncbi:hypothetical protein LX32DRAFT_697223 [Colletotrichum zoysiae]|uniref:Uncharacterized protein n=1 Tax=Colletotrichum zoysiae TaxID=1216348 RepID=A0AAD9M073_9PEZI|nr:hypothetical protein LX32DRAFT_697223 [Colletotrichum zoysiae]
MAATVNRRPLEPCRIANLAQSKPPHSSFSYPAPAVGSQEAQSRLLAQHVALVTLVLG